MHLIYCFGAILFWKFLITCLDFRSGDRPLNVSKDGVDGDGVLRACVEALYHVEVKTVPEVYVFYVAFYKI